MGAPRLHVCVSVTVATDRIHIRSHRTFQSFVSLFWWAAATSVFVYYSFVAARALALFATAFLYHRVVVQKNGGLAASEDKQLPPVAEHNSGDTGETPPAFNFSLDEEWLVYLLDSLPALIFCCAVSLVILFWARIYYAANLVAYPLFS